MRLTLFRIWTGWTIFIMVKVNKLLLMSNNDIPFPAARLNIHNPTLGEIALIGETIFYTACQLIMFSKDSLSEQDKNNLANLSNFNILMSIVNSKQQQVINQNKVYLELLLTLLFPGYKVMFTPKEIILINEVEQMDMHKITDSNFEDFKSIIIQMFNLDNSIGGEKYNPQGKKAEQIAKKLEQRKKKLSARNVNPDQEMQLLYKYISILTVGEKKEMSSFLRMTIYQISDEFNRFQREYFYEAYIRAKLAGAEGMQEVQNWMDDSHVTAERSSLRNNRIQYS